MSKRAVGCAVVGTLCALLSIPTVAQAFTYNAAGELTKGSGTGLKTSKVYAPGIRYPIEKAPSFLNSQVWGVGGSAGPKGSQCDAKNFSYPWWDNFCETRTWTMPLCPAGKGHQGQDIRASTCANKTWWVVAVEDGTITSIGTYTLYLKGKSGTLFRYGHMDPPSLQVKVGQKVSKGQKIGLVSNAFGGTPTSIHLHFDVEQYVAGIGTVFVSPYNSLVEAYKGLVNGADPCATKDCDDKNPCTQDKCAAGTCSHAAVSGGCDDGNACTLQDGCSGGACVGGAVKPCDDGNACTTDGCDKGVCIATPHSKPCNDGDPCTSGEACSAGACTGGSPKDCSDGIACTADTCAGGKCNHAPKDGTCDDGDPCTADSCDDKGCQHDASGCDDGNPCTSDSCQSGQCAHAPLSGGCDDGSACTVADTCSSGKCVGAAKVCFDENPCTTDGCVDGVCVYLAVAATCSDGDGCTSGDYCALGQCISGAPEACDDGLDCTLDSCIDGGCQHAGARQAESRTCVNPLLIEVYDVCGGGPSWIACLPSQPCSAGICGGPPADGIGGSGDVSATAATTQAAPVATDGCSAHARVSPGPLRWIVLGSIVAAVALGWRRRGQRAV